MATSTTEKTEKTSFVSKSIRKEHFEKENFNPKDLIQTMTDKLINEQEREQMLEDQINNKNIKPSPSHNRIQQKKEFDPFPFEKTFEEAVIHIRKLRSQIDEEIKDAIQTTKNSETNYKSQLSGFMTDLSRIMIEFRALDSRISKVSQTAIRIGDRLETVEQQRKKIEKTNQLIDHFLKFNQPSMVQIDPIFTKHDDDKDLYEAARLIIQLQDIANELSSPDTIQAKESITSTADRIKENYEKSFLIREKLTIKEQ